MRCQLVDFVLVDLRAVAVLLVHLLIVFLLLALQLLLLHLLDRVDFVELLPPWLLIRARQLGLLLDSWLDWSLRGHLLELSVEPDRHAAVVARLLGWPYVDVVPLLQRWGGLLLYRFDFSLAVGVREARLLSGLLWVFRVQMGKLLVDRRTHRWLLLSCGCRLSGSLLLLLADDTEFVAILLEQEMGQLAALRELPLQSMSMPIVMTARRAPLRLELGLIELLLWPGIRLASDIVVREVLDLESGTLTDDVGPASLHLLLW